MGLFRGPRIKTTLVEVTAEGGMLCTQIAFLSKQVRTIAAGGQRMLRQSKLPEPKHFWEDLL